MTDDIELVGTAEAAKILGVPAPQIARLRESGRMPKPAAQLAATTVWHRADVLAVAAGGEPPKPQRIPELVGTSECADLLGVHKPQIGRWRRAGKFPEPAFQLAAGPVWWRRDVTAFADSRK